MTIPARRLRFGLVGTGYWARIAHARALASTEGVELVAVWGRNVEAAGVLAAEHQATAFGDFDAFLADVDAVAFAVPPDVQSSLARRAADAGKHLLLEKPIATSQAEADALVRAVDDAAVASVVFFTARFQANVRAWLADVAAGGPWKAGRALWLGSVLQESNPFNTPWRREKGGLWDLGPHVVSLLWACLGPVVSVTADAGRDDLTYLVLHHAGGATSTVTVTLRAPAAAQGFSFSIWGEQGRSAAPGETAEPVVALRAAIGELADNARAGRVDHPCDVRFGRDVVGVLVDAQHQVDARRRG